MMKADYSLTELLALRKGLTDTQHLWPFLILLSLHIFLDSNASFRGPRSVASRTVTPALLGLLHMAALHPETSCQELLHSFC